MQQLVAAMKADIDADLQQTIENRRHIHMHPCIGFDTEETETYVKEFLQGCGIQILPSQIGVVGLIPGADHSRMVGLRADMDALCLQEKNDVPYRSQYDGKMHACGHDAHTAMLMAAAKTLHAHRDALPCDVLLMFQPAEEGPKLGGARIMLKEFVENGTAQKVTAFFALHVTPDKEAGTVGVRYGSAMSSTDDFDIEIIGRGGHAGQPHLAVDALSLAARYVTTMESFMSRRIAPFDPAVFSVGSLHAGTARNIVSETASLTGTIRCQSEENREIITAAMEDILKGLCETMDAAYNLRLQRGIPVLVNDEDKTAYAEAIARQALGEEKVYREPKATMGAEDFAYITAQIPSSYLWLGVRNKEKGLTHSLHHPQFDLDESALATGALVLCALAAGGGAVLP